MRILAFVLVCILFSCKTKEEDNTFKIYHLKPNDIHENPERVTKNGWYEITRNDFFVVKNYDFNNKLHKTKIDSFVVDYLKKDDFLLANKNVNWLLTFLEYGDGVNENTKHQWGTDYAIHNLFSYKKEIGSFSFNTRVGYSGSYYCTNVEPKVLDKSNREIVSDYFERLHLSLDKPKELKLDLTDVSKETNMNKLVFKLENISYKASLLRNENQYKLKIKDSLGLDMHSFDFKTDKNLKALYGCDYELNKKQKLILVIDSNDSVFNAFSILDNKANKFVKTINCMDYESAGFDE